MLYTQHLPFQQITLKLTTMANRGYDVVVDVDAEVSALE